MGEEELLNLIEGFEATVFNSPNQAKLISSKEMLHILETHSLDAWALKEVDSIARQARAAQIQIGIDNDYRSTPETIKDLDHIIAILQKQLYHRV